MKENILFISKPRELSTDTITDYCSDSAEVFGLFQFFPFLNNHVEVRVLIDGSPRTELVQILGESNQSCPVLVLSNDLPKIPSFVSIMQARGHRFILGAQQIRRYLAAAYDSSVKETE